MFTYTNIINDVIEDCLANDSSDTIPNEAITLESADDNLKIYVDIPGVAKNDVAIKFEKNYVIIRASRQVPLSKTYSRVVTVSTRYDLSKATADLDKGVLLINIPLKEHEKATMGSIPLK
jgi:HSP20 family molecular chaperone IbpA